MEMEFKGVVQGIFWNSFFEKFENEKIVDVSLTSLRVGRYVQLSASTVDAGTVDFWNQDQKLFFDGKFLTVYIFTFSVNRTFFFLA